MTELDEELGPLTVEIIDEYGKSVEYWLVESQDYNPATSGTDPEETEVEGVKILPPESYSAYAVSSSGGLIETGDLKVITAAAYFDDKPAPTPSDKTAFDGVTYTVMKVDTIYSGELPCLYILQVRG